MGKSKDLATGSSTLYQTQTTSDTRYVNVSGDTMTGALAVNAALPKIQSSYNSSKHLELGVGGSGGGFSTTTGHFTTFNHQPYADRGTDNNLTENFRMTNEGHLQTQSGKRMFSFLPSWYKSLNSYSSSENSAMVTGAGSNQPADGKMVPVAAINTRAYMNSICIKTNYTSDGLMWYARMSGYMYGYAIMDAWIGGYTYNGGVINVTAYENASGGQYFASAYRSTDGSLCLRVQLGQTGYTEGYGVLQFGGHFDAWRNIQVTAVQVRNDGSNHAF
jgi:hypothetical protein